MIPRGALTEKRRKGTDLRSREDRRQQEVTKHVDLDAPNRSMTYDRDVDPRADLSHHPEKACPELNILSDRARPPYANTESRRSPGSDRPLRSPPSLNVSKKRAEVPKTKTIDWSGHVVSMKRRSRSLHERDGVASVDGFSLFLLPNLLSRRARFSVYLRSVRPRCLHSSRIYLRR